MENKNWYIYDRNTNTYTLTKNAPQKAAESYHEFIKDWNQPFDWFAGMDKKSFDKFVDSELERISVTDQDKKENEYK